ncbi:DUF4157 domain-containing protein [Sphingomonas sp. 1P06PA]|uniref:eCIS core domain-containing protein n=1 Tax=Sphingomonas sp. 1P06PA TaxID=554121 RepID=UPI0039A65B00
MRMAASPARDIPAARSDDRLEAEADRAAAAVLAGRAPALSRAGPALRCEKTDEEKLKDGAKKVAEALPKTETGKAVKQRIKQLGPVRWATETMLGRSLLIGAGASALTGLAVARKDPPVDIPEIPAGGIDWKLNLKGLDGAGEFAAGVSASWPIFADFSFGGSYEERPKTAAEPDPRLQPLREPGWRGPIPAPDVGEVARAAAARLRQPEVDIDAIAARWPALTLPAAAPARPATGYRGPQIPTPELQLKLRELQRSAEPGAPATDAAPAAVDRALADPGRPLEPGLRLDMERRFGADFAAVRVHDDIAGQAAARAVGAKAWALGHHLAFASGRYQPGNAAGRRLIAHELAHVVQSQGTGR